MLRTLTSPLRVGAAVAAFALAALAGPGAHAQTLGIYTFTGAAGNEPTFAVDTQPTDATFSPMQRGSGTTPSASANRFAASGWTLTNAIDQNQWFGFSVTPNSGSALNLDSLTFTERRSLTSVRRWQVRSSLDNFTAIVDSMTVPDDDQNRDHRIHLPAAFRGLNQAVEFRFYGYAAEATGGTWRLDNVRLVGTVGTGGPAVPTVQFAAATRTVGENAGTVQIPVTITNPGTTATTVNVTMATNPGTATSGADYTFSIQQLTFPAGSTAPQMATLTITDDTQQEPSETVALQLMTVSAGSRIGQPTVMTITITDNDGGTGPLTPPLSTIAAIKINDAQGVATNVGTAVRVRGTILSQNLRATGYQSALQDRTGGIGLFAPAASTITFPAMSDSVELVGVISQFRGLTQITIDSFRVLMPNAPMPAPMVITTLDESAESKLLKMNGPFTLVDVAQWTNATGGFNVDITDGTNVVSMRISPGASTLLGIAAPTQPFRVTGIGSQFGATTAPFLTGYQIVPRTLSDLEFVTGLKEEAAAAVFSLYPNPAADQLTLVTKAPATATVVDVIGRAVLTIALRAGTTAVPVYTLPAGLYMVRVGNAAQRFVKQ